MTDKTEDKKLGQTNDNMKLENDENNKNWNNVKKIKKSKTIWSTIIIFIVLLFLWRLNLYRLNPWELNYFIKELALTVYFWLFFMFIKSQDEKNYDKRNNSKIKRWHLLIFTLILSIILYNWELNYGWYLLCLCIVIYIESFFTYFIKKIIPRINLGYIQIFILTILLYLNRTKYGLVWIIIFFILIFSPFLSLIWYCGSNIITIVILTIQRIIKKEKIYDDEMKKTCKWLWIGLIIFTYLLIILFTNQKITGLKII